MLAYDDRFGVDSHSCWQMMIGQNLESDDNAQARFCLSKSTSDTEVSRERLCPLEYV